MLHFFRERKIIRMDLEFYYNPTLYLPILYPDYVFLLGLNEANDRAVIVAAFRSDTV